MEAIEYYSREEPEKFRNASLKILNTLFLYEKNPVTVFKRTVKQFPNLNWYDLNFYLFGKCKKEDNIKLRKFLIKHGLLNIYNSKDLLTSFIFIEYNPKLYLKHLSNSKQFIEEYDLQNFINKSQINYHNFKILVKGERILPQNILKDEIRRIIYLQLILAYSIDDREKISYLNEKLENYPKYPHMMPFFPINTNLEILEKYNEETYNAYYLQRRKVHLFIRKFYSCNLEKNAIR